MDLASNRSRTAITSVAGGRYGEAPPLAAHTFLYAADLAPSTSGTKQPYRRGSDQVPESAQKAVLLSVERPAGISLASRRDSVRKDSVAGSVAGGADSAARGTPLPAELMNRPHRVSGPVDVAGPVSVIRRDLSNNEMVSRESIMEMQKARRRSRKSSAGRYTVATYPEDQDPSLLLPRHHPAAPPGKHKRPSGPVAAPQGTTTDSASSHADCFGGRARRRGSGLASPSLLTRILNFFTFRRRRDYASGAVVPVRQADPGPGPPPPAPLVSDGSRGSGSRNGSGHGMHGAREKSRLSQRNASRMSVQ